MVINVLNFLFLQFYHLINAYDIELIFITGYNLIKYKEKILNIS